ncbi:MAG: helix-turn-helix transcriptional regulator [Bdellovibrionales bacterium]|nr:helix-turn-helix transcriptional regulator [Bdellovibrionales bacterium]
MEGFSFYWRTFQRSFWPAHSGGSWSTKSEPLSSRLKRLRQAKGINVKEMASLLGVSVSTYRDWEYGRSIEGEPYPKMAEILSVSLYELLTGRRPLPDQVSKEITRYEQALAALKKELSSFF